MKINLDIILIQGQRTNNDIFHAFHEGIGALAIFEKKLLFFHIKSYRMADHLRPFSDFFYFPVVLSKTYTRLIKFKEKWFQLNQHPCFYSSKMSEVSKLFFAE